MASFKRLLDVSTPDGKRIEATVEQQKDVCIISCDPIGEVEKDRPPFARGGKIRFSVDNGAYQQAIKTVTSYLENLFLKTLDDEEKTDESRDPSPSARVKSRRNKKSDPPIEIEVD